MAISIPGLLSESARWLLNALVVSLTIVLLVYDDMVRSQSCDMEGASNYE